MLFSITFSHVRLDKEKRVIALIITSKTSINSYFLGKILACIIITILKIGFLVMVSYFLIGMRIICKLHNLLLLISSVSLGTIIWFSLGFICGVFINREDIRDMLFSLLTFPLTFASSIYYNIGLAPTWIKTISMLNPLTYICNLMRKSFFLEVCSLVDKDFLALLSFGIISFAFSYLSSKRLSL
jgi:ABC-2 type transport system permease protein